MATACRDHYERLQAASEQVLQESFSGSLGEEMAKSHAFIQDLELWVDVLSNRPETEVLQCAIREYQFSLLSVGSGHYRAAFAALRLALELSFAAVQWSANERELREWRRGQRDSNWNSLIDNENGILSKQFVKLFSESLADEAPRYRGPAVAVYRECSEYVHGNAHTHRQLPEQLCFDETTFRAWMQKSSTVRLSIMFALCARFVEGLTEQDRGRLENPLLDHLGHSIAVRAILGATIGE